MSKFKKKNSEGTPKISTASLPDIIFMLLFFFMVSTVMRETTLKVEQVMPEASEVQKLERKNLVSYIYVGEPKKEYRAKYGTEAALQQICVRRFFFRRRPGKCRLQRIVAVQPR